MSRHIFISRKPILAQSKIKQPSSNINWSCISNLKNVGALNNLALAYREENDPRAVETAEKAFQLNAESPPVLDTLGWLLVEQGNTTRGLPMLQKASTSAPNTTEIRYHLALGLVKAGDKVKARTELQTLLRQWEQPFAQKDEAKALLDKL